MTVFMLTICASDKCENDYKAWLKLAPFIVYCSGSLSNGSTNLFTLLIDGLFQYILLDGLLQVL